MIQCNRCNLQYIGETKGRLKDRFNEHRRTVDNSNNTSRPTIVSKHFLSNPDHTATDMQLIPIEKIFSSRDSIRKAREATLIIREYYYYYKKKDSTFVKFESQCIWFNTDYCCVLCPD